MKVLGIDLGTSSSAASVLMDGKVAIIPSSEKGVRTVKPFPSVVSFLGDGCLIGNAALEQSVYNPRGTVFDIKRRMGSPDPVEVFGKKYLPQFISALFLMKIKLEARNFLNEDVTNAVITIPASFNDVQRQATKDAAAIAGLNALLLLPEPVAASVAYGAHRLKEAAKILVFDMGAGTLDVSIIEADSGLFEVLSTAGSDSLGGSDMDRMLARHLARTFSERHLDVDDEFFTIQVSGLAQRLKISLSENLEAPYDETVSVGASQVRVSGRITRAEFEEIIADIIRRSKAVVASAFDGAGITASDIDKVVLVGGPTKTPLIRKMIRDTIREPEEGVDPDLVVSSGAAIMGGTMAGVDNLPVLYQGLTLLNVTPLDLAEEAKEDGVVKPIIMIPKNTAYPTERTERFYVNSIMATEVDIGVWQGDFKTNPDFVGNTNLGKFTLRGLRQGQQNEIDVTYIIDADGILTVRATEAGTDTSGELVVDRAWEYGASVAALPFKEIEEIEKKYEDYLSPNESLLEDSATDARMQNSLSWMCECLDDAKAILIKHHDFDHRFFDTARFRLFLQLEKQYAYAYIRLGSPPVFPIGIHNALGEENVRNRRVLTVSLVHELLHAIHPDWGHNRINPEERRLANLACYFDAYREMEVMFLNGSMSMCNNTAHTENTIPIDCH